MGERDAGLPAQTSVLRAGKTRRSETARGTAADAVAALSTVEQAAPLDAQTALVAAQALKIEQLNQALSSRDLIGQAKGILMERYRITADQAFKLLVRASQNNNHKLIDVAGHLVHSGEISGGGSTMPQAGPN